MLMLMKLLGRAYRVWDKAAEIEFVRATGRKVTSVIRISEDDLERIRHHTGNGDKYFAEFPLEIKDDMILNLSQLHPM